MLYEIRFIQTHGCRKLFKFFVFFSDSIYVEYAFKEIGTKLIEMGRNEDLSFCSVTLEELNFRHNYELNWNMIKIY